MKKLIERNNKEGLGKYFFKKAVDFAFDKSFGKSYEYFKEGLDIITCDCNGYGWRKRFEKSDKTLFNDLLIDYSQPEEYYFVKAYILSYEVEKKELYLALDAIDKYLQTKEDEYGLYIKGKILLSLGENNHAYETFIQASQLNSNPRLLYRIGKTKEQHLDKFGLDNLYNSFIRNPSSVCCARILKKYMKERAVVLPLDKGESNKLLISFTDSEDEWKFDSLYQKFIDQEYLDNLLPCLTEETLPGIRKFISHLKENAKLFLDKNNNFNYSNEHYEKPDYKRDTFDALTDGHYGDYDDWKKSGGDMDNLSDSLGY